MSFDLLDAKRNLYNNRTISGLKAEGVLSDWAEMFRDPFLDKLRFLGVKTDAELAGVLGQLIDYKYVGDFLCEADEQLGELSAFGLILSDRLVRLRNSNAPVDDLLFLLFQLFECYGCVALGTEESAQFMRRQFARAGARSMLAKDPKQQDKALVKQCWDEWQKSPDRYEGKAAFSRDMLDKFENLKSQQVIARWCLLWERGNNTQLAK